MPQLEVSTYITQIFWLIMTFLCFWLVMDKFIIPRIAETVEARKRKYNEFILKAEEINKKAIASLKNYEEALAAAKKEAYEQGRKNEAELKAFIKEEEENINARLKQKLAENEERLLSEKNETLKKIEELSQTATLAILEQLEIKSVTPADIQKVSSKEEI